MSIPQNLAAEAAAQTLGIFRDVIEDVTSDSGRFLATGTPESLLGQLAQANARQICRKWASEINAFPANENEAYAAACNPYLESIGQTPGYGSLKAPFSGGQCNGVPYTVSVDYTNGVGDPQTAQISGYGPVVSATVTILSTQTFRVDATLRLTPSGGLTNAGVGPLLRQTGSTVGGLTVTRTDGSPDDCGSPPVDYSPPGPENPTPVPPITVSPSPDTTINIDVDFDIDGRPTIIYDPESPAPVQEPIDPFAEPESPPGPGEPRFPGDIGEPGTPEESEPGSPSMGCAPNDNYLVGVRLELVDAAAFVRVENTSNGDFYRGSCYVRLGSVGNTDAQPEAAIIRFPQFFYAPPGASCWEVLANPGYTIRVIPYYREAE